MFLPPGEVDESASSLSRQYVLSLGFDHKSESDHPLWEPLHIEVRPAIQEFSAWLKIGLRTEIYPHVWSLPD